jgi:hypothetical protein
VLKCPPRQSGEKLRKKIKAVIYFFVNNGRKRTRRRREDIEKVRERKTEREVK